MFLYEICDEIRLDELRGILKVAKAGREPPFRHPAPEYVQFARPPVIEPVAEVHLSTGECATGRVAYFDYGVVSINLELPFSGTWQEVVALVSLWMNAAELEQRAGAILKASVSKAKHALVDVHPEKLTEDYCVILLPTVPDEAGNPLTAERLIENHGSHIAQIVRGEAATFSKAEMREILESRMSYHETDLLVVGWTAALVYDTPEGAVPSRQLLEYANSQLLEFRHYDDKLTQLLSGVYRQLELGTGLLARWRMGREAARLNLIRLEIRELTERVDNSIKFLSDMFAARLYRMAAAKIGVPDYRALVEDKLQSAGELYAFMMDRFYQSRAFFLELMVVVILIIELGFLFRGK
jgi:hypothetical protein